MEFILCYQLLKEASTPFLTTDLQDPDIFLRKTRNLKYIFFKYNLHFKSLKDPDPDLKHCLGVGTCVIYAYLSIYLPIYLSIYALNAIDLPYYLVMASNRRRAFSRELPVPLLN